MKKAFTLAEILIVLTIIGVMAVMTIPSLMQNANSQHKIVMFKKAYNAVTNAYATEFATKTPPSSNSDDDLNKLHKALAKQLNVKYFYKNKKKEFAIVENEANRADYWIITEDGISYKIEKGNAEYCAENLAINKETTATKAKQITCISIRVDIDGPADKPNVTCIKDSDLSNLNNCDQIELFIGKDGVTAGNPECVIAGRIISGINPRPTSCDE